MRRKKHQPDLRNGRSWHLTRKNRRGRQKHPPETSLLCSKPSLRVLVDGGTRVWEAGCQEDVWGKQLHRDLDALTQGTQHHLHHTHNRQKRCSIKFILLSIHTAHDLRNVCLADEKRGINCLLKSNESALMNLHIILNQPNAYQCTQAKERKKQKTEHAMKRHHETLLIITSPLHPHWSYTY